MSGTETDIKVKELQIMSELIDGVGVVIFFKSNGAIRPMICTRNQSLCKRLTGVDVWGLNKHQERQKPESHNISVIDLEIQELRCFSVERLITYKFFEVHTKEQYEEVFKEYREYVKKYTFVMENNAHFTCEMADRNKELTGTKEIKIEEKKEEQSTIDNLFNEL